ncbi:hypothetical protein DM867_01960 [Halosegnis rubeus]|jgi:RsiW-degrading membrane proteinase PrsW (M82 family)|uniref:Cardiolipin synthase N-terminal domain-containing protein n=1 Tax=Halosegnis rubeus TaxID=2212850 RepID=A0A5N5UE06_9EURY|nr:PLDc N-terminal domain-containing protein [Halosegnis rubeus]KAB7515930.1 hypothetical protein DM867_01960 [Halosegnis rubeus]KAB7516857.1 hypothetical protein DMP03_05690 [Halosegnis rubeus]KAB7520016.1 hypothetical protein DP108_01845 [Halosegnis rubeus]
MLQLVPLQAAGAVVGLFGLLVFAFFIALTLWVYNDAQRHSEQPAFLWAVVVFLAPVIGILLYMFIGREGANGY